MFIKIPFFVIYILLLWFPIVFAEVPSELQGEWINSECKELKDSIYYSTDKIAFFSEDLIIYSWKIYNDPHCTKLQGEYWEKWTVILKPTPSNEPGMFLLNANLIDGLENRPCHKKVTILLKTDNKFWLGDRSEIRGKKDCEKQPKKLMEPPYIFSKPIDQTSKEYIKTLKRFWSGPSREFII